MDVVRLSSGYLRDHGSSSPRLDAELLAAQALGLRRLDLYLGFDRPLDEAQLGRVRELVRRRARGEPVAYITGEREFFGRPFTVSPAVLVPRPETEILVELALRGAAAGAEGREELVLADIATGSGCIAVTLAAELPQARVVATDASPPAVEVARANARRHGVGDRVDLRVGEWCAAIATGSCDLVVSNPPYIPSAEVDGLERSVRDHEPRAALDGGSDGLDPYRELLPQLARVLRPGGWAAVEIDHRAAPPVMALAAAAFGPGAVLHEHPDLAGRPRVVTVQLPPAAAP